MSVYFISDTHFGHKDIHKKFRTCFSSVQEHDEYIRDRILSTVGKRDTLYILGDVVIHKDSIDYLRDLVNRIEYVRIILGNHDNEKGRKGNPTVEELLTLGGVASVQGAASYKDAWLTHIPIHPSEFHRKVINIHGHLHDDFIEDNRYINVACESVNYTPVEYTKLFPKFK